MNLQVFNFNSLTKLISWKHFNILSYENMSFRYNLHLTTIPTFQHFSICHFKIILTTSSLHNFYIFDL